MSKEMNKEGSEYVSMAVNKAISDIYAEHPHECNMILYIGGALMLLMGAYHEYRLI